MEAINADYNERMRGLRFAAVLGLVFWTGGLAALGAIAAPAIFDVMGPAGRSTAGTVFGEVLSRFHPAAYVCGAVVVLTLVIRAVLGPRPRHFSVRLIISALMVAAAVWSGFVLLPRIQDMQRTLGRSPASLPPDDAGRIRFTRLHRMSTSLQLVPLLGGVALLYFELED
jgi:hypothetical protein